MGLFSRGKATLPERADLERALDGLHARDAGLIEEKGPLADMCASLPPDLVALIPAVAESADDRGLLYATEREVGFRGQVIPPTVLPLGAVLGADPSTGNTLRIRFDPTVPGVEITFDYDRIARRPGDPERLDFAVTAKERSVDFFCRQVRAAAG